MRLKFPLPGEDKIRRRAMEIYGELKFLEKTNPGGFLLIDVDTKEWRVGDRSKATQDRLRKELEGRKNLFFIYLPERSCASH